MTHKGFTLLELILAMGIFSAISVASIWLVYLSMNLRDLSSATVKTEESLRIFNQYFHQAVQNASVITGSGNSLLLKNSSECWSFLYDASIKNLKYEHLVQEDCDPNPSPTSLFFVDSISINNFSFANAPLSTGGKQITTIGSISSTLPFNSYSQSFSITATSLID